MLWSRDFTLENAYKNPTVVLKYQIGSRLGHVHTYIYLYFVCIQWGMGTGEKSTNEKREAGAEIMMRLSEKFLEL